MCSRRPEWFDACKKLMEEKHFLELEETEKDILASWPYHTTHVAGDESMVNLTFGYMWGRLA